jgi:DoxX-like family
MNKQVLAGRIITTIPVLFLAFDGIIKLQNIQPVQESFQRLGYETSIALAIGLIELSCLIIYLVPRTSVFGAVLLTGFLGGAIATHVRVGDPLLTHALFPVYVALLLWTGLFLRNERLRALVATVA